MSPVFRRSLATGLCSCMTCEKQSTENVNYPFITPLKLLGGGSWWAVAVLECEWMGLTVWVQKRELLEMYSQITRQIISPHSHP